VTRLTIFLTPRRMGYAWIAGGAMWIAWLVSIAFGPGLTDLAGQVIGADYLQFYAAGTTLRLGDSAQLYNPEYQARLELTIAGPELQNYHAFITPPFLAWLYAPLSALPYTWSFAIWSLTGVLLLWFSLKWLDARPTWRTLAWCFTWYPIFAVFTFGQNSLLSLGILSLVYALWRKGWLWPAGLAASLVMYKPQLALGVGILWLFEWRSNCKALAGLVAGSATLAGLCFLLLPEASAAYLLFAQTILPDLPSWEQFPLWHLHTVRGFWRLLLGQASPFTKGLADLLTALLALGGIWGFWRFWQTRRGQPVLLYAAATCLMLWLTPHAMIYDWALLLIPAALLWQTPPAGLRRAWRVLFALIWVATFLSGPLTFLQIKILPFAVQISIPALALALFLAWRALQSPSPPVEM